MAEIPVTYLCWGCGSQVTVLEEVETTLPVPSLEKWNLCLDCIKSVQKVGGGKE